MTATRSPHRLVPANDPAAWRKALQDLPHSFHHSWEQAVMMADAAQLPLVLYFYDDGRFRTACPLFLRSCDGETDVVTPPGFSGFASSGPCEGFRAIWFDFARAQGWVCAFITQHPLLDSAQLGFAPETQAGPEVFILDLTSGEAGLFSALSRCRKRQIRAWSAIPDWLCDCREEVGQFLADHSNAFFDRIGYSGLRPRPDNWKLLSMSENVLVLGARRNGQIVAANLFGWAGEIADAPFNVSLPEGRDAATPLMWAGANLLRTRGVRFLNMGGGARPGDGIETSKRRFNCMTRHAGRIRQVFRPEVFDRLTRKVPTENTSFFPPYHSAAAGAATGARH